MKALQFDRLGALDGLRLVELPAPTVGAGEALIAVRAAGLNPSDVKNVLGRFPAYTTLPRVPGRDFAGVVLQGPADWIGAEVWGTGRDLGFFNDGSHAEQLVLPLRGLARKPRALSFAQAASCGVPYTTAINALDRSGVSAGTKLLVIGANGAVGRAAVALARQRGAAVVAAARRPESLKEFADAGIATLTLDEAASLPARLKAHFAAGAEVVFDTTGFWLPAAVELLAPFGRIAVIAAPVDGLVQLPVLALYRRGGSVVGINTLLYDVGDCAAMLAPIAAAFDDGSLPLPPEPDCRPLREGLSAYAEVNSGRSAKLVLLQD